MSDFIVACSLHLTSQTWLSSKQVSWGGYHYGLQPELFFLLPTTHLHRHRDQDTQRSFSLHHCSPHNLCSLYDAFIAEGKGREDNLHNVLFAQPAIRPGDTGNKVARRTPGGGGMRGAAFRNMSGIYPSVCYNASLSGFRKLRNLFAAWIRARNFDILLYLQSLPLQSGKVGPDGWIAHLQSNLEQPSLPPMNIALKLISCHHKDYMWWYRSWSFPRTEQIGVLLGTVLKGTEKTTKQ